MTVKQGVEAACRLADNVYFSQITYTYVYQYHADKETQPYSKCADNLAFTPPPSVSFTLISIRVFA
jgi:hypothetical protein